MGESEGVTGEARRDGIDSLARDTVEAFRFLDYEFDEKDGTARLRYAYDRGPVFAETFAFPPPSTALDDKRRAALDRALRGLHLAAGMSYYKAFVPRQIALEAYAIDRATAAFMDSLYLHGLGELAFQNGLDLTDRVRFPAERDETAATEPVRLARRALVPVGGGKDSIVSIEALRSMDEPMTLFAVRPAPPILRVIERSGLDALIVGRQVSPHLFELNAAGAYNGHVAITAILSFVAAVTAVLHDYDTIVLSNERSASVGNVVHEGREVNHQFSKSLSFEREIGAYMRSHISSGLVYFSLLRPLSELAICATFAQLDDYHDVFTSCNSAFRLTGAGQRRWCGDCPKCRFVFLALAPFLARDRLLAIFDGNDLLDDAAQLPGFEELTGLERHKPFECVGEVEESAAALWQLVGRAEWQGDHVVRMLGDRLKERREELEGALRGALTPSDEHHLPARYEDCLDAFVRARGRVGCDLGPGARG